MAPFCWSPSSHAFLRVRHNYKDLRLRILLNVLIRSQPGYLPQTWAWLWRWTNYNTTAIPFLPMPIFKQMPLMTPGLLTRSSEPISPGRSLWTTECPLKLLFACLWARAMSHPTSSICSVFRLSYCPHMTAWHCHSPNNLLDYHFCGNTF